MTGTDVKLRDVAVAVLRADGVAPTVSGVAPGTAFDTPRGMRYAGPGMFQDDAYGGRVLPPGLCCLAIAVASSMMWGAVIAGGWLAWPG